MSYSIYKVIHLAAVIIFLGNIATGLFWKVHADRSSNPQIIAHTLHGIIRSDRWFTIPAIVVILIGGFGAASKGGLPILVPDGSSGRLFSLLCRASLFQRQSRHYKSNRSSSRRPANSIGRDIEFYRKLGSGGAHLHCLRLWLPQC
jgi:hypothetical protein